MIINPEKYYNAQSIAENGFFPWLEHPQPILLWLKKQILEGKQKKYHIVTKPGKSIDSAKAKHGYRLFIKGEGIIKIVKEFEDNTLFE